MNETQTRAVRIDPLLPVTRWKLHDRGEGRLEIPVEGYNAQPRNGITDYCLYRAAGAVLAVVETKKASRNPRQGEEHLRPYVTEIAKYQLVAPFDFLSNGQSTYFWEVGIAHPR